MLNIPGKMYSTYALKQHHLGVFSGNIKCHSNTKDADESGLSQTPPPLHSPVLRLVCHTNLHLPTIKHLNFSNDSDIVVVQLVRRSTPNSFYLSSSPPETRQWVFLLLRCRTVELIQLLCLLYLVCSSFYRLLCIPRFLFLIRPCFNNHVLLFISKSGH